MSIGSMVISKIARAGSRPAIPAMMKTIECITADLPTQNGRIYSRDVMERIVDEANNVTCVYITSSLSTTELRLSDIIGKASLFDIGLDGRISAMVEIFPGFEALLEHYQFSPVGYGDVDKGGYVTNYRVAFFALTKPE